MKGLLALAVGGSAFELDLSMVATVSQLHAEHAPDFSRFARDVHPVPMEFAHNGTNGTCTPCLKRGTQFIMKHAMGKLGDLCKKSAASCHVAKMCAMMSKFPKVTLGAVMEHVRPMALSTAYCTGKGACTRAENKEAIAEVLNGEEAHELWMKDLDDIDLGPEVAQAQELALPKEEEEDKVEPIPACQKAKKPKVCPYCMMKTMKRVMMHVGMLVVKKCKTSKCPEMQKRCKFMRANKGLALGAILAKVEPWKFALGKCMHGRKHHGKPGWHHHGEHGWHHHGEHDWPHRGKHGRPHHGEHDWPHHGEHDWPHRGKHGWPKHGEHDWPHRGHSHEGRPWAPSPGQEVSV